MGVGHGTPCLTFGQPPHNLSHVTQPAPFIARGRLFVYLRAWKSFGHNSQDNLILLGKRFEELGQMPESDFEADVRQDVTRKTHSIISELESQVEKPNNSPEYWVNDVRKFIEIKRVSMHLLLINAF